ncbi:MAG: hypothetical protein Q9183_006345, partial [Haloplaca sp. 2 TL-2023]
MKAVVEYDRLEREKKEPGEANTAGGQRQDSPKLAQVQTSHAPGPLPLDIQDQQVQPKAPLEESDEYEEVEVTDDEDEPEAKRQKVEEDSGNQPVEFNEDDIAYQLAAMGQDYGLDPGEYGNQDDEDLEEGASGLPLSEDDSNALFKDMLDDHHVNPFKPWDRLIEDGHIIEDDRYT